MIVSNMTVSSLDKFCGSVLWDINIVWNTTNPDLTECFQKTVVLWITYGFLWLLMPLEIYYLAVQKYQYIPWTAMNVSKMVISILLIMTNIVEFVYLLVVGIEGKDVFPADLWAPTIRAITYILALTLIVAGKVRGLHSSGVLFIFWFLITLSGAITYRTHLQTVLSKDEVLDTFLFAKTAISFPLIVAQLILSAFADTVVNAVKDDENSLPLNRASFLSIAFFSWFDKLVWFGFRHQITEKDMWILYPEYCSSNVYSDFEKFWVPKYSNIRVEDNLSATRKEKSWPSMFTILWKMNHLNFYMSIILKLLADAFMFINPLILRELLDIVSNPNVPVWRGYLYTVIIFASSILQSITAHNCYFRFQTIGIKARSTVIAAIFRKALRISTAAKRSATVGEIVNLMSVDAQRIHDFWSSVCYGLTTPLTVPLALYLLWGLLGPSVLAGVAVIIIIIPINLVLASRTSNLQSALMKQKDERIKIMNEILSGMKVLKLYAWELSFNEQVNKIRTKELIILKKFLYFNSLTTFLFQFTPFLISVTTFATYVLIDERNILDAAKAFVSLSLFDLIRYPLTYAPIIISNTIQAMISIGRVNNFMSKPELNMEQVKEPTPDEDPVIIQDGFFAWCPEDEPILHDINLNVRRGSLIAVVGSVGSGKSSLISAILGEMEMRSGITKRVKSVAYVAQQASIQNLTLCQNILFGRQMVEEKYNTVIDACALKADLEILPGGDQTEIGEKGINLSGGQKQRISLARAVYNDADLYLLDDPLSAVDSHVGKHIFEHMIGPNGLLKEKTRILVTNNLAYLPLVDSIIVMSNGTISEVGSYKDLLEAGGAFAEFIMAYLKEKKEIDEAEVAELLDIQESILSYVENPDVKGRLSVRISKALSSEEETFVEGSSPESGIRCRRSSSTRKKSTSSKEGKQREPFPDKDLIVKKNARLTQKEQVESGSVEWSVYYYYFKSSGLKYCIISFLVLVISWSGSVGSNIWLSLWSVDKPLPDGTQDIPLRDLRLGIYAGFGGVQAIFGLLSSIVLVWANIRASNVLHNDMLLNVLRSPMFFFDTTPLGRIINRFSRDIDIIDSTVPSFIRPLADSVLQIIGVIIVICMGTPMFAVVLIPLGIIYYLIQRIFISSSRQLKRLESITRSPIFSHFSETISGLSTIRAYREQRTFTDESDRCVDSNHRAFYPLLVAKRWLAIRLDLLGAIVVFCAALFSLIRKDSLDPGTVGLSVSYGLSVTFVLTFLVRYWTEIESNSVSLERIREYSQTPTEAEWSKSDFRPMSTWPDEGHVKWDHYSTKYREGLDLVLRGITCNIQGGEKIGIVGRTGAGKSSLTLALFRIIEAFGGSIAIDGVDISKLGLHDLRSRLTIIPQDPVLFCGTLRMNLDPFNKYSDEEVWKVLEHSHLKKFVMTLPEGLYYKVAEGGENLSVGQRQLVCLARALLRKTKVLVLDEATAAVDLETDDLIQATIRKEFADCTVLTIAHRLNTIMDSTRIMVLSNGTVIEFDSPTVLLQNQQSVFYSMAEDAGLV